MKASYLLLFFLILSFTKISAQWDGNPGSLNNLVTTASNGNAITVSDKFGGAIRSWESNKSIFIQRKTVGGIVSWNDGTNPVLIFQDATSSSVEIADMIIDGNGGVYISWVNHLTATNADLYLQHIGSNGQKSWNANGLKINPAGVAVCTEGKLCISGSGVVVVWGTEKLDQATPSPDSNRLYLQKYNPDGTVSWPAAGTLVSKAAGLKFWPVLAADSSNGVYVSFTDTRNSARAPDGTYHNFDLFMQHFSSHGQRLWSDSDVVISNQPFHQTTYNDYTPTSVGNRPSMLTDNLGSVMIVYENYADDFYPDNEFLEVQKFNFSGIRMWSNAARVDQVQGNKIYLQSVPDGDNGLVLCWKKVQAAATVFAQRITADGTLPWGIAATAISSSLENDFFLSDISMAANDKAEYVVTWRMDTTAANQEPTQYLKAQKFDNNGMLQWPYPGVLISTVDGDNPNIPQVVKSLDSSFLFTWKCSRGINAALLDNNGVLRNQPIINYTAIASGNWNDPSIWAGNVVPLPGANITITQNIHVNVNIICNSITVQPPAILTAGAGSMVTIFNN